MPGVRIKLPSAITVTCCAIHYFIPTFSVFYSIFGGWLGVCVCVYVETHEKHRGPYPAGPAKRGLAQYFFLMGNREGSRGIAVLDSH